MKHTIDVSLMSRPVSVDLVGCGGTGSQVLSGLARLHVAMRARGHPYGLNVTAWDPDTVSEANVGRQLFSPYDVGQSKAEVLISRLNLFFGLDWGAIDRKYAPGYHVRPPAFIISCVDTRKARAEIAKHHSVYLLDCGNTAHTGQVVLGGNGIPSPYELFPQLVDTTLPEDNTPSCSLAEALHSQSLFINQMVATHALQLMTDLFFDAGLDYHGVFFDIKTHRSTPLMVDEATWNRIKGGPDEPKRKKRKHA